MPFFFKGKKYTTPVTTSYTDDSGMLVESRRNSLAKVLVLIGIADSGEPLAVTTLYDAKEANDLLGISKTNLSKAIEKAFNPSPETLAPEKILFVRVNPDSQAQGYLQDATPENAILVKSAAYGVSGATVNIKVANGTQANTKKITVSKIVNGENVTNYEDNLSANLFNVTYAGAEVTATLAVSSTQLTVVAGTTTNILFSTYQTIQDLVAQLNQISGITATILNNSGLLPSTSLDVLTATSIKNTTVNAAALTQMVTDVLNTQFGKFAIAERQTGTKAVANTAAAGLTLSYTPGGAATLTDWQNAFDVVKKKDCLMVVPLTDDPDVAAMATAHCDYMSDIAKMERYCVLSMPSGTLRDQAVTFAEQLNHKRSALVFQELYLPDINGKMTLYPSFVFAALVGGAFCGVSPGTALTNKEIDVLGVFPELSNPEDTDVLLAGGVMCCWTDFKNVTKVLQSITTAQTANFAHREMSVGIAQDTATRLWREAIDVTRGRKNTPFLREDAYSISETLLSSLVISQSNPDGILVGDSDNPAWKDLVVTQGPDWIICKAQISPVLTNNYVGIEVKTTPYMGGTTTA